MVYKKVLKYLLHAGVRLALAYLAGRSIEAGRRHELRRSEALARSVRRHPAGSRAASGVGPASASRLYQEAKETDPWPGEYPPSDMAAGSYGDWARTRRTGGLRPRPVRDNPQA